MLDTISVQYPVNAYGVTLSAKTPALKVSQSQQVNIQWPLNDSLGNPVDLTPYVNAGAIFTLYVAEAVSRVSPIQYPATVITPTAGLLQATLDPAITARPGVYMAQFTIQQPLGTLLRTYEFYILVERGLFLQSNGIGGPPSIADIRLRLRDNCADDNDLIDRVEFDLSEIISSLLRPVQYWNEVPPPLDPVSTTSFTETLHWLDGTVGCLLKLSANWYRRNRLLYSAGGTTVDDRNKENEYTAAGDALWQEYQAWVSQRKVQINVAAFSGSIPSSYSWIYRNQYYL